MLDFTDIISIKKTWIDKEVKLVLRYIDFHLEFWNHSIVFKVKIENTQQLQNLYFALTNQQLKIKK